MASESKPHAPGPPQALVGCVGTAFIGIIVIGIIALMLLFHPFGPMLWFQWQENSAELEAAQDTAQVFLEAVRNEDGGSAYALLSKDYRDRLSAEERSSKKLNVGTVGGRPFTDCKVGAGKLSNDKGLATFEGFLQTKNGQKHSCRLVIVKEGSSRRVDLFTVEQ
jgi:hypothetical protein